MVAGLFDLVNRLYGIRVTEEPGVPVWDPQVQYYNMHDENGVFLGGFYADWYPAREQARRRLDGRADHRRPGAGWLSSRTWD